jgi:hypothetical protein
MAAPGNDWINQAMDEVVAVLAASTLFMDPSVLQDGTGIIKKVDRRVFEPGLLSTMRGDHLPYAGVAYLGHTSPDEALGTTDYQIDVGVQIVNRSADWNALWEGLQRMGALIPTIAKQEEQGEGFGGFAYKVDALDGQPLQNVQDGTYTGVIQTGFRLTIERFD